MKGSREPTEAGLFIYSLQAGKFLWVGRVPDKDRDGFYGPMYLRWTNDNRHLSYVYKGALYIVTVE